MNLPAPQTVKSSNQRRSQRVMLRVGIAVSGTKFNGRAFQEDTHTLVVNAHGALILLKESVTPAQKLLLRNKTTGEERECKVVDVGSIEDGRAPVGVEFSEPSPRFWRVAFPPEDWTPRSPEAKRYTKAQPVAPTTLATAKPAATK